MAANIPSVETKSKFGVPVTGATGSGILMPKLKYRFRVSMLGGFAGEPEARIFTQNVQTVGRPTYTAEPVEIHSYNSRAYIQGKHNWETIDVGIRDDISNGVSKLVGAQVQRQLNHFQQTTPASASDYKFDMQIEVLDGASAGATEVWFLEGCFLTNVAYGDHDYTDTGGFQMITITVRYDNATHYAGSNDYTGDVPGIGTGTIFPESPGLNGTDALV